MIMSSEIDLHEMCVEITKKFTTQADDASKWNLLKEFFDLLNKRDFLKISSDYHFLTTTLLDCLRPTLFSEQWQEKLFDDIFLQGINHEAFIVLVRKFGDSCESYQQKKILDILHKFLKGPSLENLFLYQCSNCGTWDPNYVLVSTIWDDVITFLVSLPERVANKIKEGNINKIFRTDFYVPLLASTVIKVFSVLHDRLANSQNCTLEFIGKFLGRLCIIGHADILAKRLCVEFIKHCESNFIWRKLSKNLITKMTVSSLESFITHLLLVIPWFGYVDWILGEETVKTQKLNFLMTVKLITVRNFKEKTILQNIIGHFASAESRQDQFWKIFESLLKLWTNSYNLKYQSHDQQMYIAVALMICSGWLRVINDTQRTKAYISQVLEGAELRVGNPTKFVRIIGMVVASELTSIMHPESEKLEFEEAGDEETVGYLKSFTKIQQSPGSDTVFFEEDLKCFKEVESAKNKWQKQQLPISETTQLDTNILNDSDDDLEPYDMTDGSILKKPKHPLYLNDCLQGLIEQDNREWFEECLKHAEHLIKNNTDNVHEFAEEMAKVVLHLDNKFSIDKFSDLRMQILVALAVRCPLRVSKYLTGEFYERNYNIQQRLDMLEVISRASLQLSQINSTPTQSQSPVSNTSVSSKEAWKLIVEQRIAAKTRYITKGPRKPLPEPVENIFAPVAGFFFFPLIQNFYKKNEVLKFFGEDSLVLGKLIYTLGIVMYAALNSPHAPQMGETLLELLGSVWNHEATVVREAVLFALITVYESVPGYMLFAPDSNLQLAVFASQKWLEGVVASELDVNCQVKASVVQSFIMNKMKAELPHIPGFN